MEWCRTSGRIANRLASLYDRDVEALAEAPQTASVTTAEILMMRATGKTR